MSKPHTKDSFIKKAKAIHGNRYNYSYVNYVNSKTKITIVCRIHGKFLQAPGKHLSGQNCSKCSDISRKRNKRLSPDEIIKRSRYIHKNKYNYELMNYSEFHSKITIICTIHGKFSQTPFQHIYKKCGCKKCFNKNVAKPIKQFVIDANSRHHNKYDYSLIHNKYNNAKSIVPIICKKHGIFNQSVNSHLNGRGCPKCKYKTQLYIYNVCVELFPDCNINYNFRGFDWLRISKYGTLELDIYIKKLKLAIEYDGEQHFRPVCFGNISKKQAKNNLIKTQKLDALKEKLINEYKSDVQHLIRFNYKELPLNKKYIKNKIESNIK